MLLNHLDEKATLQIIGLENDYDKAIQQLDKYYSDNNKVIKACLDEIRAHPNIGAFDYKGLVSYKKCLINNHTRLKSCNLEHEMSNTAALSVLVRKLPIQEAVKWPEHLAVKEKSEQSKPFPHFMEWLEKAGNSWELLAAAGMGSKTKGVNAQVHHSFFNDGEEVDNSKAGKPCFKCGEQGHWKKDCPKVSPNRNSNHNNGSKNQIGAKTQKDRSRLKYKKFHCALHQATPGKNCSSWSCVGLKYTPVDERIQLLKDNGECELCCGAMHSQVPENVWRQQGWQRVRVQPAWTRAILSNG